MEKAIITDIINNFKSKKGNAGTLIIATVGDKEIVLWSSNPDYSTAFRTVDVKQDAEGFWKMQGNFITQAEKISLQAEARAKYAVAEEGELA